MSLPLCGCVGVHHAGRVHPGANSQRLLLHAGRGPSGKVVLYPEHLRGPDDQTAAAAAVRPGEQNNSRKNKRRKKNGKSGRSSRKIAAVVWSLDAFSTNVWKSKSSWRTGNKKRTNKNEEKKKKIWRERVTHSRLQWHNFWLGF